MEKSNSTSLSALLNRYVRDINWQPIYQSIGQIYLTSTVNKWRMLVICPSCIILLMSHEIWPQTNEHLFFLISEFSHVSYLFIFSSLRPLTACFVHPGVKVNALQNYYTSWPASFPLLWFNLYNYWTLFIFGLMRSQGHRMNIKKTWSIFPSKMHYLLFTHETADNFLENCTKLCFRWLPGQFSQDCDCSCSPPMLS